MHHSGPLFTFFSPFPILSTRLGTEFSLPVDVFLLKVRMYSMFRAWKIPFQVPGILSCILPLVSFYFCLFLSFLYIFSLSFLFNLSPLQPNFNLFFCLFLSPFSVTRSIQTLLFLLFDHFMVFEEEGKI